MKKVLAVTGIRSEYDILYPVINKMRKTADFDIKVVISGSHLSDLHGQSANRIEEDGFVIADKIDNLLTTNRLVQRSKSVGLLINGLSQTVERERPDFLFVVGDREESIATCIVGNYMNVLTAHLGGGDPVYGNADDPIRFACSKLAHIHFVTAKKYAENLRGLGEEDFRICFSGNPANSNIIETENIAVSNLANKLGVEINIKGYLVFIKHPLSSEFGDSYLQMKTALTAVKEFAVKNNIIVIGIRPNSDPGSYEILKAINEMEDGEHLKFFSSLPRNLFINLIRNALCIVGNSSMGILEAPFYKLPVVNIGNRQKGRLNVGNVEFTDYQTDNIQMALFKACFNKDYREYVGRLENLYDNGNSAQNIINFINGINLADLKWYTKIKLCL
jgi:GDP/UDP-N,N'-diacetylbacillosamine 2-epimerase (hydrolysing)